MVLQACRQRRRRGMRSHAVGAERETACVRHTAAGGSGDGAHEEWAGDRGSQHIGQGAVRAICEVQLCRGADQRGRSIPEPCLRKPCTYTAGLADQGSGAGNGRPDQNPSR